MSDHPTVPLLIEKFGQQHIDVREFNGNTTVVIPKSILVDVITFLYNDPACGYKQLTDVWGVDYLDYPEEQNARFGVLYPLLSIDKNRRIIIKVFLSEDDLTVPTLNGIYKGSEWSERETAEMYGITFEGHPDPRRILLCDLFEGKYPLRKTYPLKGQGERESFTPITTESA